MKRENLLDFFDDRIRSKQNFFVYDDGYRSYTYSYEEIRQAAYDFSERLVGAGFRRQDKVIIWSENRPEWVVALWGSWLARCVVVPVDYRASEDLLSKIVSIVESDVVLIGDEVPSPTGKVKAWPLKDLLTANRIKAKSSAPVTGADNSTELAEIIFTSGATADPKGVQLTHRNILANTLPVEREILKYRKYAKPFSPIRFLNLLPLSHMFGQAMATFIPPMLSGVTVFMHGYNPSEIVNQIRKHRVSVLVCVPKMLEVLREHIEHLAPEVLEPVEPKESVALRWWRYRRVHRLFGMKFWTFVVGAAALDKRLEEFWSRLGFLVIQGYGLTETAPIVTLNHPFRTRRGSVGKPIGGVEVKIASDGEILVRGENVTTGYFKSPTATTAAFQDGWFHTGDIGTLDASGQLTVRGRKKETIVTSDGLNVFPDDVEQVLRNIAGVRDATVVGAAVEGTEKVHAVLILRPETTPSSVLETANAKLEEHQMIKGYSLWPSGEFPRTEGTQKLKRHEIRRWLENKETLMSPPPHTAGTTRSIIQNISGQQEISANTTIEELGFNSIERIELMMAIEQQLDRSLDEQTLRDAGTVAGLEAILSSDDPSNLTRKDRVSAAPPLSFPKWNRSLTAKLIRRISLNAFLLPLTRLFAWIKVEGLEHLHSTSGPVVYAANHQSHLDGPVILAALPVNRRIQVATAAAKEFFAAHFYPEQHSWRQHMTSSFNYYLGSLLFNIFPLPQREAGTREAIRYLGELLGDGNSVLIFPEGRRTTTGEIDRFQPGIGMIASRLNIPVVPVRLEGIDRILHQSWRMARPGPARVAFGKPLNLTGDDYPDLAKQVEDAVREL